MPPPRISPMGDGDRDRALAGDRPSPAGPADVLGAILAGGLARRMGGGDKTLLLLSGRTMLSRVLDRFTPQCGGVVINANGDPARFAGFGLPVVADTRPGQPGPLAGVLAALDHAAACHPGVVDVATVPGDAPFLPTDLVGRLRRTRTQAGAELACAASGGRIHPVAALWPLPIRDELRSALHRGERAVGRFAARFRLAVETWPDAPTDPFFNVNGPADVAEAEARLRHEPGPATGSAAP